LKAEHALVFLFLACVSALLLFPSSLELRTICTGALLLLMALLLSCWGKSLPYALSYLGLSPKKGELQILVAWGFAGLAALLALSFALSAALYSLGLLDTFKVEQKILTLPALALLSAFTLSPIAEEMLFRGYFFRKITESSSGGKKQGRWAIVLGAVFSSLLFASLHLSYGSIAEIAAAFLLGLLLCALTHRTKSIVPSIVAHASFNLLSILFAVFL